MIIGATVFILLILIFLNLILGNNFIDTTLEVGLENEAIVNGTSTTFLQETQNLIFYIDTSNLILAGITLLTTIIIAASITGITVLGSGLNPQSSRIIVLLTAYIGLWSTLSILVFSLINSILIFGSIIYIGITLGYAFGVVQKISGSE